MAVIVINQTDKNLPVSNSVVKDFTTKLLREIKKSKKSLSIVFVSQNKIKTLNFQYRKLNKTTDVLSFSPNSEESEVYINEYLGDIIISPEIVKEYSISLNIDFTEEIYRCIVHGVLHLIGMDHKYSLNDKEPMFRKQEKIIRSLICNT